MSWVDREDPALIAEMREAGRLDRIPFTEQSPYCTGQVHPDGYIIHDWEDCPIHEGRD